MPGKKEAIYREMERVITFSVMLFSLKVILTLLPTRKSMGRLKGVLMLVLAD